MSAQLAHRIPRKRPRRTVPERHIDGDHALRVRGQLCLGSFFYGPVDGSFSPNISPDSSAQAIGLNNGSDVATIPPFSPPGSFHADAVNYDAVNNGTVSLGDRTISIFGAGSPVGSYIFYGASAVPEPSSIAIMCLGLALLGFAATRTHRPIGRSEPELVDPLAAAYPAPDRFRPWAGCRTPAVRGTTDHHKAGFVLG